MKVVHERQQQRERPDLWPQLKEKQPDLWLVIETYRGKSKPYFVEGSYTLDPRIERVTAFSLTEIFSVLQDKTSSTSSGTSMSFMQAAAALAAQSKVKATGGVNG